MTSPDARIDGWEVHDEEQRRSWLRLTPAQRLAWLEGAKEFAREALGAAYRRPAASSDSRGETRHGGSSGEDPSGR
jgi:hypothetical protein